MLKLALSTILICSYVCLAQTNVLTQHNDIGRTGQNLTETALTPANVGSGNFGKLAAIPLDGKTYAQPLYVSNVQIGGSARSVVFVATEHDSVYALDVNANGAQLWKASLLDAAHGAAVGAVPDPVSDTGCNDVQGTEWGITSTPVIDATTGTMYVVAKTYEGTYPVQRLHALDITSGAEKFGGPITIQATAPGTGSGTSGGTISFDPKWENQRAGLLLVNGTVYIAWAAMCDFSTWHGWIMGYSAASGQLVQTSAFLTSPNGIGGGIWMGGTGLAADNTSGTPNLFAVTGNGTFDALGDWGDTVLKMTTAGPFQVQDSFTPSNQDFLNQSDLDLGSGGFLVLPDQPGTYPHLGIVISKQGELYLLNRDSMGGNSAGGASLIQQLDAPNAGLRLFGDPAYFNGSIYFWPYDGNLVEYSLTNGLLSSSPVSAGHESEAGSKKYFFGASPSISANGTSNGIVWADDWVGYAQAPLQYFYAYDATDLSKTLWSSSANAARDGAGPAQKFAVPTIADGKVFLASQNQLLIYGLFNTTYGASVSLGTASSTTPATATLSFTANSSGATVSAIQVLTDGVSGGEFALANGGTCSIGSSAACTVAVTFTPAFAGLRKGAVVVIDSTGHATSIFVSGVGAGTPIYSTPVQTTLVSGLNQPAGVAVDGAGNVYSANAAAGSVSEVDLNGNTVRTITGLNAPYGVALDGAGTLYISEAGNADVVKVAPGASTFSAFVSGFNSVTSPQGMTTDAGGNLYLADTGNNVVDRVTPAGVVSQVNTGSITLSGPGGVAIDAAGNLFIADSVNGRIVEVPVTGAANTAVLASGFQNPTSLAIDAAGDIFVTDSAANLLFELPAGSINATTVGSGFSMPYAVAVSAAGDLYVADELNGRIVKIQRAPATGPFQSITFNPIGTQSAGTNLTLTATASSGLAVIYSSSTPNVCTVTGTVASLLAVGSCTITASQAGNTTFKAADPVSRTFAVLAAQTITFTSPGPQTAGTALTLAATASSGLAVVYSSSTTAVCTVSGISLTLTTAGTCSVTASQTGNSTYAAAPPVTRSFTVTVLLPVLSGVTVTNITANSATISWTTDQATNGVVNYGAGTTYTSASPLSSAFVNSHSITLTGLIAGSTYYFDVVSVNSAGTSATSPNGTFTTLAASGAPPYVGYVAYWGVNNSGAIISWSTDALATTFLAYGTTPSLGQLTPVNTALTASHGVTLTGLNSGTTYYFVAESTAANGATGFSTTLSFTTTGTPPPVPVISNVAATSVTTSSATITWTTDQATSSQVNYGSTTLYGSSSALNSALVTNHSVTLTNLTPGANYNYDVVSTSANGITANSTNYTFTAVALPSAPSISNVLVTNVTTTSATISWTTDQAATSLLNYGLTTAYGSSAGLSSALVTNHQLTLTDLTPGSTYNYNLVSANLYATAAVSANHTFQTAALPVPPVISNVATVNITSTSVTITWTTDQPSSSQVNYGPTSVYGSATILDSTLNTIHTVTLTGLAAGTAYNYDVVSATSAGASASSSNNSFNTAALPVAPIISNVTATSVTDTTVTLTWTTDQAATSLVNYGAAATYGSASAADPTLVTIHSVTLPGLLPGTSYNYEVVSANSLGLIATSINYTFTTISQALAPIISNVLASNITSTAATITWSTDQGTTALVNYGTALPYDSASVLTTTYLTSQSVKLTGLTAGTTYNYDVVAANPAGTAATSANFSFTTPVPGIPPLITNVTTTGMTSTSVTITWNTDQPANATVNYGVTGGYGNSSGPTSAYVTNQSVTLTGLTAGTTYNFDVVSAISSGSATTSANYTFTTAAAAVAPVISNVTTTNLTSTSITINWNTDQASTSLVNYGTATTYGLSSSLNSMLVTTHSVTLTGLTPGTTYNYDLVSANAAGTPATSPNLTFAIPALPMVPVISSIASSGLTTTSATITWTTDQATTSLVTYGLSTSYGSSSALNSNYVTAHSVTLTGLTPGTTYNFAVVSMNSAGTSATSTNNTLATGTAPPPTPVISGVTAMVVTATSATITWTTDIATTSLVSYGTTTAYGTSSPLGVAFVTSHSVSLTGLTAGTTYNFAVSSASAAGVSATSANTTFSTGSLVVTPVISNVSATGITATSATITWTTDQATSSQVNYGTTTAYGSSSPVASGLVTSHSVTLSGLAAGTTYDYSLVSMNAAGTAAVPANYTFTTPASTAVPPYVGYVAFWGINNSGVTISWSTDVPATTVVAYGTTPALGQLTPVKTALSASHGVVLTGLNAGTTYYFVAQSTAATGATGYSTAYSFTTTGVAAVQNPVISNVTATSIGSTSAIITWTTDQATSSQVNYGTGSTYGLASALSSALVTNHSVTLSGLTPGTTYNYDVVSANSAASSVVSGNYTFATTAVGGPPVISNVLVSATTVTTATISWTTDQASSSLVNYGTSAAYGSASTLAPALVTNHSVTLTGLTAGTTYNYDVVSANSTGASTASTNATFSTLAASATAPHVDYVAYWGISNSGVTISWSTDVPATEFVAYGTTTALGQLSPVGPTLATSHGITLTGLSSGTTYYFAAQSTGANGATGSSTTYSFTTTGSAGLPVISAVTVVPGSGNSAVVKWTTSVATYSYVQYGTTTTYNRWSALTSLTSSPQPSLGYVPSGIIHYQLVSTDAYGNQVFSPDYTFTEP